MAERWQPQNDTLFVYLIMTYYWTYKHSDNSDCCVFHFYIIIFTPLLKIWMNESWSQRYEYVTDKWVTSNGPQLSTSNSIPVILLTWVKHMFGPLCYQQRCACAHLETFLPRINVLVTLDHPQNLLWTCWEHQRWTLIHLYTRHFSDFFQPNKK